MKDTDEQPDEELYRVRSRSVQLGCATLLAPGCASPPQKLSKPCTSWARSIINSFSSSSPLPGGWAWDWKRQVEKHGSVFPVPSSRPKTTHKPTKSYLI